MGTGLHRPGLTPTEARPGFQSGLSYSHPDLIKSDLGHLSQAWSCQPVGYSALHSTQERIQWATVLPTPPRRGHSGQEQ